ncbi:MAG: PrsW family intramembrane metalloprotease [Oscillospiraceae bacterium]|nr:PrsW family intramembrane metalloprotease [Oscillospiraceae bacterium]
MIYAENILLCIAVPLLITLFFLRGNARRCIASLLIGMIACLLAAYISGYLQLVTGSTEHNTAVFLSPIVEELLKCMPLLLYLLLAPKENELLIASVAIGAGFATFENCCHLLSVGASSLLFVLIRGLAVGVMHIVCTTALALGLMVCRRHRALTIAGILGALSLAVGFHGLYNLLVSVEGCSSYVGYALPIITAAALSFLFQRLYPGEDGSSRPSVQEPGQDLPESPPQ